MRIGSIVQGHVSVELGMPQHKTLALVSLPDRQAVQRQESAGEAWVICPQTVFEAADQRLLVNLFPGRYRPILLLDYNFSLRGRNTDSDIV